MTSISFRTFALAGLLALPSFVTAQSSNSSFVPESRAQAGLALAARIAAANLQFQGHRPLAAELEERLALVEQLMRTAPSLIPSVVLDDDLLRQVQLDPALSRLVESSNELTGTLEEAISDDFVHQTSESHWSLLANGKSYELYFAQPPNLGTYRHRIVKVSGIATEHVVATESVKLALSGTAAGSAVGLAPSGSDCSTTGPQNTAVVLVKFPAGSPVFPTGMGAAPYWTQQYSGNAPSLNTYWKEVSDNQTSATAKIFGPITLSQAYRCDQAGAMFSAVEAALKGTVNFSLYDRYTLIFPADAACNYGGLGTVGCYSGDATIPQNHSIVWAAIYSSYNTSYDLSGLLDHEHGHNLGLNHSNSLDFGSTPLGPIDYLAAGLGVNKEYGDPFAAMGDAYADGPYTSIDRAEYLDWIPPADVQVVKSSGNYLIAPLENSTGSRALRVLRDPVSGSFLWMEFRQPVGYYDSGFLTKYQGNDLFQGALVHYENGYAPDSHSLLVNFNPVATPNNFSTPDLLVGHSWSDPYSLLSLKVTSSSSSGLAVRVLYDNPCARVALSAPTLPQVGGTGTLTITAPSTCAWTVSTAAAWLTLTGATTGTGNGSVTFNAAANSGTQQRQTYITAQRQSLPLTQLGPDLNILPGATVPSSGASKSFVLTASDTLGASDIQQLNLYFLKTNASASPCYVAVNFSAAAQNSTFLYLYDDAGSTTLGGFNPGSASKASNSTCTLNGTGSSAVFKGGQVVLTVNMSFAATESVPLLVRGLGFTAARKVVGPFPMGIFTPTAGSATAAAVPIFSPKAGTYAPPQPVTLTDTTPGAVIYYTLNGSAPTLASTKYTAPISVSATETIQAIANAAGYTQSPVGSATYTISAVPAAAPVLSPAAGTYTSTQTIAITDATHGATLYYTLDGSTPTVGSTKYTGPVSLTASATLKAIAAAPGFSSSAVTSAKYTLIGSPSVLAGPATLIATPQATVSALANTLGLTGTYYFRYGISPTSVTSSSATVALAASVLPVPIKAVLPALKAKTKYYFYAVVTTAGGTGTSSVLSFTTN